MKTVVFKIEGMHCDGCAATINAMVKKEAGVQMGDVSFKNGEGRILYDPAAISEEHLAAVIERLGYHATRQ